MSTYLDSSGIIGYSHGSLLNGNCSLSSSVYTCNFKVDGESDSIFSSNPVCNVTTSFSGLRSAVVSSVSTTQIVIKTYNSSGTASDSGLFISCHGILNSSYN